MKAIVTVVGKDRVGIIANVCVQLASFNVNVLDISQTVMQGYLTMMMAVDVSACKIPLADLVTEMRLLTMGIPNSFSISSPTCTRFLAQRVIFL